MPLTLKLSKQTVRVMGGDSIDEDASGGTQTCLCYSYQYTECCVSAGCSAPTPCSVWPAICTDE